MKRLHKRLNIIINSLSILVIVSMLFMFFGGIYNDYFMFSISSRVLTISMLFEIISIVKLPSVIKQETKIREELFLQSLKSQYNIK